MVGAPFLSLLLLAPAADPAADVQARAEAAFREGATLAADDRAAAAARQAFARSAQLYEQLEQDGCHNADLYRNLGNAYFLAGDLPRAIRSYRRGLRLTPNDLELRRCLAHAREQVEYPAPGTVGRPPTEHRPPWLPRLPAVAPWLAFGLYFAACLAAARWWMVRRGPWRTVSATALGLALCLGAGLAWEGGEDRADDERPLVVIAADGVLLRRGNGLAYPARYPTWVNKGVEARRLYARGDWVQIELSGGEVGWVPRGFIVEDH